MCLLSQRPLYDSSEALAGKVTQSVLPPVTDAIFVLAKSSFLLWLFSTMLLSTGSTLLSKVSNAFILDEIALNDSLRLHRRFGMAVPFKNVTF
jgi:hypothetical protein